MSNWFTMLKYQRLYAQEWHFQLTTYHVFIKAAMFAHILAILSNLVCNTNHLLLKIDKTIGAKLHSNP